MKPFVIIAIILVIGFLAGVPVTKHILTRNEVERELEAAMIEYQTVPRDKFNERLDRIAEENELDPSSLEITIDDSATNSIVVTIAYQSRFSVFFVPVTQDVVITRSTTKLGMQ